MNDNIQTVDYFVLPTAERNRVVRNTYWLLALSMLPTVLGVAQTIAGNAPLSIRQAKKSVRFGMQMELQTALRYEAEAYDHLVDTDDRLEGVRAFNEKRKPNFQGR